MPPKNHRKSGAPTQGRAGQKRKNVFTAEVIADSDDEFEHLAVKAEDRYVQTYYFSSFILWYLDVFISLIALMMLLCLRSATMKWMVKMTMN
jgi:hypothetical protein